MAQLRWSLAMHIAKENEALLPKAAEILDHATLLRLAEAMAGLRG